MLPIYMIANFQTSNDRFAGYYKARSMLAKCIQATLSRFNEASHTATRHMRPNLTPGCSRDTRGLPRTSSTFEPRKPSSAIQLATESFLHPLVRGADRHRVLADRIPTANGRLVEGRVTA